MGHSDSTQLQDLLPLDGAQDVPAPQVRVWGDTSQFTLWEADELPASGASARGAVRAGALPAPPDGDASEDLYQRIGQLTRTLHDAMHALGYHDHLADACDHLPEARDRLAYVARMTGDAAEKVLNAVDSARSLQNETAQTARALENRWSSVAAYTASGGRATPAGAALVAETRAFLATLDHQAERTNAILTDIMMAQDFHDLTGQVIFKVMRLAQTLEEQLVQLLLDANPAQARTGSGARCPDGPATGPQDGAERVFDQAGADRLLASLGF